jgi:hypothetical protein
MYPKSKCLDPDPGSSSFLIPAPDPGLFISDHISKCLLKIFGLKIIKFFVAEPDPRSVAFFTLDPGSVINIPDPQQC